MFQTEQHLGEPRPTCRCGAVASERAEEREPLIVDWDEMDRLRWAAAYWH